MIDEEQDKKDINYDIDFIDPEDLIAFISETEAKEGATDIEEEQQSEAEESRDEEDELKYTDILKESPADYIKKRQEDTRGRLALVYTIFTFLIFFIIIIVAVVDGLIRDVSIVDNLNTLLPLVSGIFLGTLGFVLGYYFKKGNDS